MAKNQEVETVQLRNINSGAIVSVAAEKVVRMGSEWASRPAAKKTPPAKKTAAKKAASKKATSVVTTETVSPEETPAAAAADD